MVSFFEKEDAQQERNMMISKAADNDVLFLIFRFMKEPLSGIFNISVRSHDHDDDE